MQQFVKSVIMLVAIYIAIQLVIILGGAVFDFAKVAAPGSDDSVENINSSLEDGGNWLYEHSGMTKEQHEASMNAAGLYYNPETGKYEEDAERFSRELDMKYRNNNQY